jgi:predicted dinucleotide-binding enzyme
MRAPRFGGRAALMLIAGDDPAATSKVVGLATDLGFDALGLEGLAHARALEALAILWISLASSIPGRRIAFHLAKRAGHDVQGIAASLVEDLGLEAIDADPLKVARHLDAMAPLWPAIAKARGTPALALTLLRD